MTVAKKLIILLVVSIVLVGCESRTMPTEEAASPMEISPSGQMENNARNQRGITRSEYNCTWKFPSDEVVISMSEDICMGKLWVLDTLPVLSYKGFDSFDWDVQYSQSPNTFQLQLQCLNTIVYLTKAYELTGKQDYMNLADEMLLSWVNYKETVESENNPFTWYDHGSALRAENLIYYYLVAEENGILSEETKNKIESLIEEHAAFLADNANYTKNHNHGIFQDRALIYCAQFLNNDKSGEYFEMAKSRLQAQKEFAFNKEMVHVENSPGYQIGVMDLFRVIAEFLIQFDDEFGNELYEDVKKSCEFMAYIIKPNGSLAEIGDTSGTTDTRVNDSMLVFEDEHLIYASTLGEEGKIPEETSKIYPEAGYYISHNNWNSEPYDMSTWQMFKSGYSSKTHKHADDNSFMLYSKGYDIFVDTGWYNYMSGNKYRDYFISSSAHNTVIVDGKSYSPTEQNSTKAGIFAYEKGEDYDYVLGYNEMYSDVKYDRHFYNLGDAIILYDNLVSDYQHTYSQLLHGSEALKLVEQTKSETVFSLGETGYFVRVKQLLDNGSNSVIIGDFDKEKFGYISRELGHLDSVHTLKYEATGTNVDFLTLITIENREGEILGIQDIHYDVSNGTFEVEKTSGNVITIKPEARTRINGKDVTIIQKDKNTFSFVNNNILASESGGGYYSYAWYIVRQDSAETIMKGSYTEDNCFEYTFDGKGVYFVKAYTRDTNSRYRTSAIVAAIQYDEETDTYKDITELYPYLSLEYQGQRIEQINDTKYRFIVDYNYSWNSYIRWYVYKDGGYYTVFSTENQKSMEFEFTEDGTYTIMYYLTTPNGDNEFWNFPEIEIDTDGNNGNF